MRLGVIRMGGREKAKQNMIGEMHRGLCFITLNVGIIVKKYLLLATLISIVILTLLYLFKKGEKCGCAKLGFR